MKQHDADKLAESMVPLVQRWNRYAGLELAGCHLTKRQYHAWNMLGEKINVIADKLYEVGYWNNLEHIIVEKP